MKLFYHRPKLIRFGPIFNDIFWQNLMRKSCGDKTWNKTFELSKEKWYLFCHVTNSYWLNLYSEITRASRNMRNILSLSYCNEIWTRNHLGFKRTLNHLPIRPSGWLFISKLIDSGFQSRYSHLKEKYELYNLIRPQSFQKILFPITWNNLRSISPVRAYVLLSYTPSSLLVQT